MPAKGKKKPAALGADVNVLAKRVAELLRRSPGPIAEAEYLTARQVSERCGVALVTLVTWRAAGTGPAWIRVGSRAIRYPKVGLDMWLRARAGEVAAVAKRVALSRMGAQVRYCGHDASFVADVLEVGDAVVVISAGNVHIDSLLRRPAGACTHEIVDFPVGGYWGKARGVFVVPRGQVRLVEAAS